MKVEEIAEPIAKLPPDQLARFRARFTAFEAAKIGDRFDVAHKDVNHREFLVQRSV